MTSTENSAGTAVGPVQAWKAACPQEARRTLLLHIVIATILVTAMCAPAILMLFTLVNIVKSDHLTNFFIASLILLPPSSILAWIFMSLSYVSPVVAWAKRTNFDVTGFLKQNADEMNAKPKLKNSLEFWVCYCLLSPKGKHHYSIINLGTQIKNCASGISVSYLIYAFCLVKVQLNSGALDSFQLPLIPICIDIAEAIAGLVLSIVIDEVCQRKCFNFLKSYIAESKN